MTICCADLFERWANRLLIALCLGPERERTLTRLLFLIIMYVCFLLDNWNAKVDIVVTFQQLAWRIVQLYGAFGISSLRSVSTSNR